MIVAGAGPVGLAAAIDLAQRGIDVLVLDEDNTVSVGSRAICWSKRTLEILDRLGCGERLVGKGVRWSVGRVFFRDEQVYEFNLLPESGHHRPAFINLQQYWVEQFLVERAARIAAGRDSLAEQGRRRSSSRPIASRCASTTPDGEYRVHADWLIVADGARSPIRGMLGLESEGQVFRDRFLIADIHMTSDFPAERWFWFDPPFHPQPVGAAASAGRQRLARRLPAGLGRRPGGGKETGEHPAATAGDAGREGAVRDRVGERLHLPVPADAQVPARSRAVRRRCGAPGVAVRRARREQRHPGRRQPGVEARTGDGGSRAASACSTPTTASASRRRREHLRHSTRSTDFITPKSAMPAAPSAMPCWRSRSSIRSRGGWSTAGRLSVPAVLARLAAQHAGPSAMRLPARWCRAPCAADAPVAGPRGDWLLAHLDGGFTLLLSAHRRRRRCGCATLGRRLRSPCARGPGRRDADAAAHCRSRTRMVCSRSATMRSRAPATCCGPISTSARAGARSTWPRVRAAVARATRCATQR